MLQSSRTEGLFRAENPLINPPIVPHNAPALDRIDARHHLPAIFWAVARAQEEIERIKDNPLAPTFANTIEALEFAGADLTRIRNVFANMSVSNRTPEFKKIEPEAVAALSRYESERAMDADLFERVATVYDRHDALELPPEQRTLLENTHNDFKRNGVDLKESEKINLKDADDRLSKLRTQFRKNFNDAAGAFQRVVSEGELEGVPERAKDVYRQQAKDAGYTSGEFLLVLQPFPNDVMRFSKSATLREDIYRADRTCCYHDAFDNTDIIMELLRLRYKETKLLDPHCDNYAEFVTSKRMTGSANAAQTFLEENLAFYQPVAAKELEDLRAFAKKRGNADLKPWDLSFYSNLLMEETFHFKSEDLRPYFSLEQVIAAMGRHAQNFFDIELRKETTGKYPVQHSDIETFEIYNKGGQQIGILNCDYFARGALKTGGARHCPIRSRGVVNGEDEIPISAIYCDFDKPVPGKPTLLSFSDVLTLFHELGHGLHNLLGEGRYPSITGTNVVWDWVETPSKFTEACARKQEVLEGFRHYETGEPLPQTLLQKLKDSANFQVGMRQLRSTFIGLLDMAYYSADPSSIVSPEALEKKIAARATLMDGVHGLDSPTLGWIFSGAYAAGYHVYQRSESMAADLHECCERQGLYHDESKRKLRSIFTKGGTVGPRDLYKEATTREEPDPDALFRSQGLLPSLPRQPASAHLGSREDRAEL